MTRIRKWFAGIAVSLMLLVTIVYSFDWNLARPYIARKVSSATGRSFAINGDLDVHLSLQPRIIVNDVVMGNAEWSNSPVMVNVKHADFRIDLMKLLGGRLALPEIFLSDIHLVLEENTEGEQNWVFDKQGKQSEFPEITSLAISRGTLKYRDVTSDTDMNLDINTIDATIDDPASMLELSGNGRFKGIKTTLKARGGALLSLRNVDQPYPFKASATLGTTKAIVDGTLTDPFHLKGEEINFRLDGSNLALLYTIFDIPVPPTPAYKLTGFLNHTDDIWAFKRLKANVGKSDLGGEVSVDRGKSPQMVTANLASRSLNIKDLNDILGTTNSSNSSHANSGNSSSDKLLPSKPFSLEILRTADTDIRFKGEKIVGQKISIDKIDTHIHIKDGVLKLAPLNFGIAGGDIITAITMDGRKSPIVTHADITVRGLHFDQLFPASKLKSASAGVIGGRARLDATGNSIAQMLGNANGETAIIMDGGTASELLMRLSGLDIAHSMMALLGGNKQVPIRCMVANFEAVDGNFKVQNLLLDTPKVNISGEGDVNFNDETLHLKLLSRSKGFSLVSLRGPINVSGTFKKPSVKPDMRNIMARSSLAVGLGIMTAGINALIPLLQFGSNKESNCAALMSQTKLDAGIK